jgi:hypothetical protein
VETLPKTLKMKKIRKAEIIYIQNGLASNKHWILSIAWLLGLKRHRYQRMTPLCNSVAKAQVKAVQARLNDSNYPTYDLESILRNVNLDEYRPTKNFEFIEGFVKGNMENFDVVAMSFGIKNTPYLDIEYAALCYFDPETKVFIRDSTSPVILTDKTDVIVALIAPLNPEKINNYLKGNKND